MFGVSFSEVFIIAVISLIFFKPAQIISFFSKVWSLIERVKFEAEVIKNDILLKDISRKETEMEYEIFIPEEFSSEINEKEDSIGGAGKSETLQNP